MKIHQEVKFCFLFFLNAIEECLTRIAIFKHRYLVLWFQREVFISHYELLCNWFMYSPKERNLSSFLPFIFLILLDNILTCPFGELYIDLKNRQITVVSFYLKQSSLAQVWKTEIEMRLLTMDICWANSITCFKHTSAQNWARQTDGDCIK